MKTRMQPVETVWAKLPRVVRDLSLQCGKKVALQMEGRETELDRTILEAIKDPLTHLVRNAIDHGVESPDIRTAAGKPAEGTLLLRAFHEGGRVVVEIRDDGAGIDAERVAAKALERGLVSRDQVARMTDREIQELIFLPGFSTAAAVTNVSGRGVGMDVVKTNIERIGGTVEINSTLDRGTACRLTIPLTLAIVPALTVACGQFRYAIPQVSLLEVVYIDGERASSAVEYVSGAPVYRLRGRLLPLVRLADILEVASTGHNLLEETDPQADSGESYVVVLESEERRFGLIVDRVLDTEEIVVKALSQRLKGIGLYAGATILGDGAVALILDIQALARRSHEVGEAIARSAQASQVEETDQDIESMLVVGVGDARRIAIPLDMVTRLEEFPAASIEHVGGREVVQYRDAIVPLIRLGSLLGAGGLDPDESVLVVVYSEQGRSVALAVAEIIDIVEDKVQAKSDLYDHGLTGSVVIRERVTELLDVRQAVLAADPHFYDDLAEVG
jgi:two-component system chemotaxis sensor kinase CheA